MTRSLAPVIEALELDQPLLVDSALIESIRNKTGPPWPTELVIQRLREAGWLLDLKTKGVWEYAPAARAGAFSSGDPLVELRATLHRRPGLPLAAAAETAAWLLGYSSRLPQRAVVAAPPGLDVPPALSTYRVVRWQSRTPSLDHRGLPVWAPATLLAAMAVRPSSYRDWPNVGEWLEEAAAAADLDDLTVELETQPRSAWARAGYLLARGGRHEDGKRLLDHAPQGTGPYYLGDRSKPGTYSADFDVVDTSGVGAASIDN